MQNVQLQTFSAEDLKTEAGISRLNQHLLDIVNQIHAMQGTTGHVAPDNNIDLQNKYRIVNGNATNRQVGVVKPDNQTTKVDGNGVMSATPSSSSVLKQTGYIAFVGGLYVQWGAIITPTGDGDSFTFAVPFPSICFGLVLTDSGADTWSAPQQATVWGFGSLTNAGFKAWSEGIVAAGFYGPHAAKAFYIAAGA